MLHTLTTITGVLLIHRLVSEECPIGQSGGAEQKYIWRCATHYNETVKGRPEFDEGCVEVLKQKVFWGYEGGDECAQYWGGKKVPVGLYDRFLQEVGFVHNQCVDKETSKFMRVTPVSERRKFSKEKWIELRVGFDSTCIKEETCKFQWSHFGMCSNFFKNEVEPNCGNDFGYREKYCVAVCPKPEPVREVSAEANQSGMLLDDFTPSCDPKETNETKDETGASQTV